MYGSGCYRLFGTLVIAGFSDCSLTEICVDEELMGCEMGVENTSILETKRLPMRVALTGAHPKPAEQLFDVNWTCGLRSTPAQNPLLVGGLAGVSAEQI